jgi:uncharacterized protein YidB (DUF937 family)
MGLLDQVGQAAGGLLGGEGGDANPLLQAVLRLLAKDSPAGGLDGLIQAFRQNGLSDIVNSWIGTGPNLPVSSDQMKQGLGSDLITQLATAAGLNPEMVSSRLTTLLPGLIDKLTPEGKVPNSGLLEQGLNLLKGNLG